MLILGVIHFVIKNGNASIKNCLESFEELFKRLGETFVAKRVHDLTDLIQYINLLISLSFISSTGDLVRKFGVYVWRKRYMVEKYFSIALQLKLRFV